MNGDSQLGGTDAGVTHGDPSTGLDFVSLFCRKFGCDRRKFEKRMFLECVHPEGLALARCLRWIKPGFFATDLELIEQIQHATSFVQVCRLVDYHDAQHLPEGLLRLVFKVRVSKTRLLALAETVFATVPKPPPSAARPENATGGA
jgi:hypothetical protein